MMCTCRTMCFYVELCDFGSHVEAARERGGSLRPLTATVKSWSTIQDNASKTLLTLQYSTCMLPAYYKNSRRDSYHSSHGRKGRGMVACICMNKSKPLHIKLF